MAEKIRRFAQHGQLKGPPEPINNRIVLKLAVSDAIKARRGMGTGTDSLERHLERVLNGTSKS